MSDERYPIDRAALAARWGIEPATITRALSADRAETSYVPKPDGYVADSPYWWSTTIEEVERRGRRGPGRPWPPKGGE